MNTKIEFDTTRAEKELKVSMRRITRQLEQLMNQAGDELLEETVKRVPIDEGNLQHSVEMQVEKASEQISAEVFIPSNSPAADYALAMHEDTYELGETSEQKQAAQPERIGRKYLERAFLESKSKIRKMLEDGWERITR